MSGQRELGLFEGYGIELEYMIVHGDSLAVLPAADRVLQAAAGAPANEARVGDLEWSNEMVLHVIELKTAEPAAGLDDLPGKFNEGVRRVNALLAPMGGTLMPTGMHPFMDPRTETEFWPHGQSEIYGAYQRAFDCRSHGWANLQSAHINLPFSGDGEFARLMAAVRLALPIIPAIAASSPVVMNRLTGYMDTRLKYYGENQVSVPSIAGSIIPEPVFSIGEYVERVLEPMYRDIAPLDPEGILRDDWLNSRGAIANFDRNTVEIRVLDTQECPGADIALAALVITLVKSFVEEVWQDHARQRKWDTRRLAEVYRACVRDADAAVIDDTDYLSLFGITDGRCTAGALWRRIVDRLSGPYPELDRWAGPLGTIADRGPLAMRIVRALGGEPSPSKIKLLYKKICNCLREGDMFSGMDD